MNCMQCHLKDDLISCVEAERDRLRAENERLREALSQAPRPADITDSETMGRSQYFAWWKHKRGQALAGGEE